MAEQARKNLNRIKSPENEKLNLKKVAPEPLNSQMEAPLNNVEDLASGRSYDEHIQMLAGSQSSAQLTAITTQLQRTYGNAYVQKLFSSRTLQARLKVKTADFSNSLKNHTAVVSNAKAVTPQQQEEEEEELQTTREKKTSLPKSESVEARIKKAGGSGQPLPYSLRVMWEPKFGKKVNQVRIHTDAEANALAHSLKAAAFTSGRDIFFRKGVYNPDTLLGRNLIVRELSHVAQQERRSQNRPTSQFGKNSTSMPLSITPMTLLDQGKTGQAPLWQAAKTRPIPVSNKTLLHAAPHVFVNGGKTGAAAVWWGGGGGGGGRGNQYVGDVTEVQPRIKTSRSGILGLYGNPVAWVERGTGTATVTRSYVGVLVGANGTYYITQRAADQIDRHEEDHVNSSRRHHDTYIIPLEARVAEHTGSANALQAGDTKDAARVALETYIDWTTAISNFQTNDNTDNYPMGAVDQADQADPNTKFDYGPRTVDGVNYAHYVDTPPGPPAEEAEAEVTEEVSEEEGAGEEVSEEGAGEEQEEGGVSEEEEITDFEELEQEFGESRKPGEK
jgi:hypothetical protein